MKDHINNEDIWREANAELMTTFLRQERLRWYGQRKEEDDTTKTMIRIQVQGKRRREVPRKDG